MQVQNCHKSRANNWCFYYERLKTTTGRSSCLFDVLLFQVNFLFIWRLLLHTFPWFCGEDGSNCDVEQVDEILPLLFVVITSVTFTWYLSPSWRAAMQWRKHFVGGEQNEHCSDLQFTLHSSVSMYSALWECDITILGCGSGTAAVLF